MSSGPRRRTLAELLEVCGDEDLFAPLADGRVVLMGRRGELERALGVNRGSLWRRLQTLVKAGLAEDDGRLVVDLPAVQRRLEARVVSLPTERTRQYQQLLEDRFETAVAADGTATYHHPDGRKATLSDVAEVTGASSRGTAHHHLRRLQSVPQAAPTPLSVGTIGREAAEEQAIASLAHLHEVWRTAGLNDAATTVLLALDSIARCAATAVADTGDAAFAARDEPRRNAALREPERGANAAHAPANPPDHEYENESPHPHDATAREAKRDTNAAPSENRHHDDDSGSSTTSEVKGCPAASRTALSELEVPDWAAHEAAGLVQPLIDAFADQHGSFVTVDTDWFVEDMLAWPRAWIDRAVAIMAGQIRSGRGIDNPGGLFAKAVQGGWYEYFPATPPPAAPDPVHHPIVDTAERVVAEAEQALERMGPGIALDVTFDRLAHPVRHGELDVLELALPALLESEPFAAALRDAAANDADPAAPLRNALVQFGNSDGLLELLPRRPMARAASGRDAAKAARNRLAEAKAGTKEGRDNVRHGGP